MSARHFVIFTRDHSHTFPATTLDTFLAGERVSRIEVPATIQAYRLGERLPFGTKRAAVAFQKFHGSACEVRSE